MRHAALAIRSLALLAALAGAAGAQQPAPQKFGVPGQGNLLLNVPPAWNAVSQGSGNPPAVIVRMRPATGDAFYVQITSILIPPDKLNAMSDETIRSRTEESAKRMLPRAVETEASLVELRGKDAAGYYFMLTDRNSPNTGNEYKHVLQGSVRTGAVVNVFTLLYRAPAIPEKDQLLRMMADASFEKGAASANTQRPDALQVAAVGESFELSVPVSKLVMTLPKGRLTQAPGGDASHPRYFYFLDGALNVSGWFEPAEKFRGMKEFWEGETRALQQRGLPEPKNVVFAKFSHWDVVLYDHDLPGGGASSNSHARAHWVQSGTWIDLHISLTAAAPPAETRQRVQAYLESIQVKEKP